MGRKILYTPPTDPPVDLSNVQNIRGLRRVNGETTDDQDDKQTEHQKNRQNVREKKLFVDRLPYENEMFFEPINNKRRVPMRRTY